MCSGTWQTSKTCVPEHAVWNMVEQGRTGRNMCSRTCRNISSVIKRSMMENVFRKMAEHGKTCVPVHGWNMAEHVFRNMVEHCKHSRIWQNMAEHDRTWQNMTKHDVTWPNMAEHVVFVVHYGSFWLILDDLG